MGSSRPISSRPEEQAGGLDAGHRGERIGWEPDRAARARGGGQERRRKGLGRRGIRLTEELQLPGFQRDRPGDQGKEELRPEGQWELREKEAVVAQKHSTGGRRRKGMERGGRWREPSRASSASSRSTSRRRSLSTWQRRCPRMSRPTTSSSR